MSASTKTAQDAYRRMDTARCNSLGNLPTLEYLYTLQSEVADWFRVIGQEVTRLEEIEKKELDKQDN